MADELGGLLYKPRIFLLCHDAWTTPADLRREAALWPTAGAGTPSERTPTDLLRRETERAAADTTGRSPAY